MLLIRQLRVICQVLNGFGALKRVPFVSSLLAGILGDLWRNRIHESLFTFWGLLRFDYWIHQEAAAVPELQLQCHFFRECFTRHCEHHHAARFSRERQERGVYAPCWNSRFTPCTVCFFCSMRRLHRQILSGWKNWRLLLEMQHQQNHNISQTISSFHTARSLIENSIPMAQWILKGWFYPWVGDRGCPLIGLWWHIWFRWVESVVRKRTS